MLLETVEQMQRQLRARLSKAGIGSAALDARLIMQAGLGISHEDLIARPTRPIAQTDRDRISRLAKRRLEREPLSRILGEREFYGRMFELSCSSLDPRPATETLIDRALHIAAAEFGERDILQFADLGTGTGAIAVTLLAELAHSSAVATDISFDALTTARSNAIRHGVAGRLNLVLGSWLDSLSGPFDLMVCNPPYILSQDIATLAPEVRLHDPHIALDGGEDGLDAYRALSINARKCLKSHGFLCLEIGRGQEGTVEQIMIESGLVPADGHLAKARDLTGTARVLTFGVGLRV